MTLSVALASVSHIDSVNSSPVCGGDCISRAGGGVSHRVQANDNGNSNVFPMLPFSVFLFSNKVDSLPQKLPSISC